MIKNKELLEIIERKKNEVSCENCAHCNLNAFHRGKWYCDNSNVHVGSSVDIEKCFRRRLPKERKNKRSLFHCKNL